MPGNQPADYEGGRIQRVDLETGAIETLYTECDGMPLKGPNDIVFDSNGSFWFTDHGKLRERDRDRTGVFYAHPDGSSIREMIFPVDAPNGVGLAPDGQRLYVSETFTGRALTASSVGPEFLEVSGSGRVLLIHRSGVRVPPGLPDNRKIDQS